MNGRIEIEKTVLITSCCPGLRRTTAVYFANQGWNVVATMRKPKPDNELAAIEGVFVTHLDVEDPVSIEQAVAASINRFSSIDVLVNNAGLGLYGILEVTSREKIRESSTLTSLAPCMSRVRSCPISEPKRLVSF